jgi:thiamine-phosphate pyrophosphorylase
MRSEAATRLVHRLPPRLERFTPLLFLVLMAAVASIHKQVLAYSAAILSPPVLSVITPDGSAGGTDLEIASLVRSVKESVDSGASIVQLRDTSAPIEARMSLLRALRHVVDPSRAALVVNIGGISDLDGGELLQACPIDGVHIPERMISAERVAYLKKAVGKEALIGCSAHSVLSAQAAAEVGADYIQVGTMFETQSHVGKVPEGVGLIIAMREALPGPHPLLVGVGGITAENCADVICSGASGVAVISSVLKCKTPGVTSASLLTSMVAACAQRGVL